MFTNCNEKCVQPYVFGLLVLPMLVTPLVASITAYTKNRSEAGKSFLIAFVGSLVALLLIWYLLKWLCNNNHCAIAWLVAILPLVLPVMYGYYFGLNTKYSVNCHQKLRNTISDFKCE